MEEHQYRTGTNSLGHQATELLDRYLHALKIYLPKAQGLSQILAFSLAVTAAVFAVDLILNFWRLVGRPGANLVTARGTHARS